MFSSKHIYFYYRGRVALSSFLKSLNLPQGGKVAIQAFTCIAVPEAVIAAGLTPVFIDIESDGVNMSLDSLSERFSDDVRALVIQHTFGVPSNMSALMSFARDKGLFVIEDCCHTYTSQYEGKPVGSFGDAAFYSLEWGKPIIAGNGGILVVNNEKLLGSIEETYRKLKHPGIIKELRMMAQFIAFTLLYRPGFYWTLKKTFHFLSKYGVLSGNFKSQDDLYQLENSPEYSMKCLRFSKLMFKLKHKFYNKRLRISRKNMVKFENFKLAVEPGDENLKLDLARFPVKVKNKSDFLELAEKSKLEAASWYMTPVHPLKKKEELSVVGYELGSCPNAETLTNSLISLPLFVKIKESSLTKYKTLFEQF